MSASLVFLPNLQGLVKEEFLSDGSFVVPENTTTIFVLAAGGGAGANDSPTGTLVAGGAGAIPTFYAQTVVPGSTLNVTIGAGGAGGATGGDGGNTIITDSSTFTLTFWGARGRTGSTPIDPVFNGQLFSRGASELRNSESSVFASGGATNGGNNQGGGAGFGPGANSPPGPNPGPSAAANSSAGGAGGQNGNGSGGSGRLILWYPAPAV